MKGFIFDFDIEKVKFEERYENKEYEMITLYFIAPKEWLNGQFPEAVHSEISVEYPMNHPEAIYATVMMSPTKEDSEGHFEDYDWFDIILLPTEIELLMNLAKKQ